MKGYNQGKPWAIVLLVFCGFLVLEGCPSTGGQAVVQATRFVVQLPDYADAGSLITVTVSAVQSGLEIVPTYGGTVHFTSSDPGAVLPVDYTFTTEDQGTHTFTALTVFKKSGEQTLTVSGVTGPSINATQGIVVLGGPLAQFLLSLPLTTTASGNFIQLTVTAVDAYGNTISTYTGSVGFTTTDPKASPPGTYSFNPLTDEGTHTFTAIFGTGGSQDICISDAFAGVQACAVVYVFASVTSPGYGLGQSSAACSSSGCPPDMGTYVLEANLTDPSTGLPLSCPGLTAVSSNAASPVTGITYVGGGDYLVGMTVTIPSAFILTISCPGYPSILWGGLGFTQAYTYPTNCTVGSALPSEVAALNPAAGTVNTLSSIAMDVKDKYGNPIIGSIIGRNNAAGSAQPFTVTDSKNGSYTLALYDASSEIAQVVPTADGKPLTTTAVSIIYTSLAFPATAVELPTTVTNNLTATLSVGGTPTAGRTTAMAFSGPGGSAVLSGVTDNLNGTYTASISDTMAEKVTVIASEPVVSGAKGIVEVRFVSITVTAFTGTTIAAGNGVTITATIQGPATLTGRTVNLTSNSPGCTPVGVNCGPVSMTDNGDGTYSITGITDIPETVVFTATDQNCGASATITVTFQ